MRRAAGGLPAALGALVLALALGCGATTVGSAGPDGRPRPGQLRGINTHLWPAFDPASSERELDLLARAGGDVVRIDVSWGLLEPLRSGQVDRGYLRLLDRFVAAARARGIAVLPTLIVTPCWASDAPAALRLDCDQGAFDRGVGWHPPREAADYGRVAAFLAGRYGAALAALEVWNEPDLCSAAARDQCAAVPGGSGRFWRTDGYADGRFGDGRNHEAERYAELVLAAHGAIRALDGAGGRVPVLAGALSTTDGAFLGELYAQPGFERAHDGISLHPYVGRRAPGERTEDPPRESVVDRVEAVRRVLRAQGARKPLWITEVGWTTCEPVAPAIDALCVTEQEQAERVAALWPLLSGAEDVRAVVLYELRDRGPGTDVESAYGLVEHDLRPKPGYAALGRALGADEQ